MAYPRYTLNRNSHRESVFTDIWAKHPRLRGRYAETMEFALEELAGQSPAPMVQADDEAAVELDDDLFDEVEI
jgi:hypothetical protein